jgi:hypothetical protein
MTDSWESLFGRAGTYDRTLDDVRDALAERRDG